MKVPEPMSSEYEGGFIVGPIRNRQLIVLGIRARWLLPIVCERE